MILARRLICTRRIEVYRADEEPPIAGGGKLSDYIDIIPVTRCTNEATEPETEDVNFYCMEVCDTGDDLAS